MSNFSLSKKGCFIDKYKTTKGNAGYTVSGVIENESFSYLSFHKLNFKNENFLLLGEDFVSVLGTLIYKGSIDGMLLNIYNDWNGNIQDIRKNSIGSYCVIIKKGDIITVFGEENYLYNIYYYITDDNYILSNSFFDVQSIYGRKFEIDKYNFLELVFNTYVLCNETIFKEVKRLCGDEYIQINLAENRATVKNIKVDWMFVEGLDYNERIKRFSDNLIEKSRIISNAFGAPALSMTGGLDSRLCLAPVLANGVKPNLYYGVGNSILTDTKSMDLNINKIYSKKFDLSLDVMDWSTVLPVDKEWKKYFDRYSESFVQYNASSCVYESLENIPNHFITFGYFGELFRNIPWIENLNKEYFTIDEYIDDYFMLVVSYERLVRSSNISYDKFRQHIKAKMLRLCNRYGLNPDKISVDEYRYLYIEYIRLGESIMLNLVNKMRYICYPIAEDNVYKNYTISKQDNIGAKFMLDAYRYIYSPVLEIPFFSHCELRSYDFAKGRLNPPASESFAKITKKIKFISRLLPLSLKLWILRTFVTKDAKATSDESNNNFINDIAKQYLSKYRVDNLTFEPFTHRNYIYLSQILFALNRDKE